MCKHPENTLRKENCIKSIFLIVLLLPSLCCADLYYWVDEKGVRHYSNTQPQKSTINQLPETYSSGQKVERSQKKEPYKKTTIQPRRTSCTPRVNIEYEYYDVKGVNINDLRSETIKHSPLKRNGITFRGMTNWYFKPHYIIKKLNGLWYYDNVSATVDIKFTMPKWADYKKANWGEQKRWDAYYKALLDHEKCHKDIAVAAAMKLCRVLVELKSPIGKEELRKIGNFKYWEIYRECKKLNQQFDDKTGHGHKTGVILR